MTAHSQNPARLVKNPENFLQVFECLIGNDKIDGFRGERNLFTFHVNVIGANFGRPKMLDIWPMALNREKSGSWFDLSRREQIVAPSSAYIEDRRVWPGLAQKAAYGVPAIVKFAIDHSVLILSSIDFVRNPLR
jgi:hypothetical protein